LGTPARVLDQHQHSSRRAHVQCSGPEYMDMPVLAKVPLQRVRELSGRQGRCDSRGALRVQCMWCRTQVQYVARSESEQTDCSLHYVPRRILHFGWHVGHTHKLQTLPPRFILRRQRQSDWMCAREVPAQHTRCIVYCLHCRQVQYWL
jgi:hypothetical protein